MTEDDFDGPERRRGYRELFKLFEDHAAQIEARLSHFIFRGSIGFAVIGLSSAIALVGFGIVLKEEQQQTDQIQESRADLTRLSCEDTNDRNRNTTKQIVHLSGEAKKKLKTKHARDQVDIRTKSTLSLIDALVPVQNCDDRVAIVLGKKKPKAMIGPSS